MPRRFLYFKEESCPDASAAGDVGQIYDESVCQATLRYNMTHLDMPDGCSVLFKDSHLKEVFAPKTMRNSI